MINSYLAIVEEELKKLEYPDSPGELYEPIEYILALGGKRIRPILCLMAAELYGADIRSKQYTSIALAIEIFHNFSLVHDDIMDEAPLRRGKETVHQKWNRDIAILSGDVMLVQAYDAILKAENENFKDLIAQFNRSAIKVCEGQQYDMNFETSKRVNINDYIEMISLKTAELIGCSLKLGAIASNASKRDAELLYSFGLNLGLAFQIQDDYLDAFGESEKVGKQVGGDILANKKTYLMLKTLELANEQQKADIERALNYSPADKVEAILQIFNEVGVKQHTMEIIDGFFQKAVADLKMVSVEMDKKEGLSQLANYLMKRDH